MFTALEKLSDDKYINRAWENIKEDFRTSVIESLCLNNLKQLKPWFNEEYLVDVDQSEQVKM
jgi:hypothetical protein